MRYYLDTIFSALGASFAYFFGGLDGFIHALLAFVILDYISGVLTALQER